MSTRTLCAASLVLALFHPATPLAQSRDSTGTIRGILAAEDSRFAAMVGADTAALRHALADELRYIHSSGRIDTKQQYVASIASGVLHYHEFAAKERRVRLLGVRDAVVIGTAHTRVESSGQLLDADVRYTAVYERMSGHWRLVAWQTTRVP